LVCSVGGRSNCAWIFATAHRRENCYPAPKLQAGPNGPDARPHLRADAISQSLRARSAAPPMRWQAANAESEDPPPHPKAAGGTCRRRASPSSPDQSRGCLSLASAECGWIASMHRVNASSQSAIGYLLSGPTAGAPSLPVSTFTTAFSAIECGCAAPFATRTIDSDILPPSSEILMNQRSSCRCSSSSRANARKSRRIGSSTFVSGVYLAPSAIFACRTAQSANLWRTLRRQTSGARDRLSQPCPSLAESLVHFALIR
jgi:hypothetical protein